MKVYLIFCYAWVTASSGRDGALKNGYRPGDKVRRQGKAKKKNHYGNRTGSKLLIAGQFSKRSLYVTHTKHSTNTHPGFTLCAKGMACIPAYLQTQGWGVGGCSISIWRRKQSLSPWVQDSFNKPKTHDSSNFNFASSLLCWSILWVLCESVKKLSILEA